MFVIAVCLFMADIGLVVAAVVSDAVGLVLAAVRADCFRLPI